MQSAQWVGQTSRFAHPPRTVFAQRNQPAALGLHPAESMRAALCADARRPSPVRHSGGLRYTLACRIGSFEVAERSNIRQRKHETILIFVAHRSQRKAPEFQAQAATVPGVTRLRGDILQRAIVRVKTETAGGAQAELVELPVAKQQPKLVELARRRRSRSSVDHAQKGVASAHNNRAETVVHQRHAGIDAAVLEV